MNNTKRLVAAIVEFALGLGLLLAGELGLIDGFWSSLGIALMAVAALFFVRVVRYNTNEDYRERFDTAAKDERNRYIATKAWAWAGYFFVIAGAVATVVLRIAGQDVLSMMASGAVCLIMVLYWLSYLYLSRKY